MKSSIFRVLLAWTTFLCFFSCTNSNEPESTSTTTSSSDTITTTTNATASTGSSIVTTPMDMVLIRHKVKDFGTWLTAYEEGDSMRRANGLRNYSVSTGMNDSNMVQVALIVDNLEKARAFVKDNALKTRMQKAGVTGTPRIEQITITYRDTVRPNTPLRSLTEFAVKDWANWEKNFKDGEQERIANGIAVRAYGHDADNNNKVCLVTAILDTAKASAYWKSDMLKKRREAGGVIGEPERFVHRVVQRY